MKDINIKHIIIGLIWITASTLHANSSRDSLSFNPNWNTLFPFQLSDNGEWLIYYQNYINAPEQNKVFAINTNNRKTTELTRLKDFVFFENDMLIGKSDSAISIYNLQASKIIDQYSNVQNFDALDKINAICYLTDNQQLNIIQYKKHKPEKIISDNDITQYQLSPDKKQLLYLKENQALEKWIRKLVKC